MLPVERTIVPLERRSNLKGRRADETTSRPNASKRLPASRAERIEARRAGARVDPRNLYSAYAL
eukprot:14978-Pelagococcus_subviridis.AAC.1